MKPSSCPLLTSVRSLARSSSLVSLTTSTVYFVPNRVPLVSCDATDCAISGLLLTTAMCFVPAVFIIASLLGRKIMPNMNSGSRMVLMRNDLVRTRSRYSRRRISPILRIVITHHVDKDLFQRWLDQLELIQTHAAHRRLQQRLRVCPRPQFQLNIIAVVVERLHQLGALQKRAIAFVFHLHIVL